MENFVFHNPTKILFGQVQIARIGAEIPAEAKVLLLYGGGSIRRNGVYDQVAAALTGRTFGEFPGIEPNPRYATLLRAIDLVRREGYDFLLAVGGGSVLDGVKFVAAAAKYAGDPWDIIGDGSLVTDALPIGTVLTLPGTGSEMNGAAVISRDDTTEKLAFISPHVYPRFSVLDPATTFSLPPRQVGNGVVDAFVHVVEQYLTYPANAPLQDRFAESVLRTLAEEGPTTLANPADYASRATVVWCTTMALNGVISVGVPQDWATHAIGHELTALYGIDHARTLAVVLPSLLRRQREDKRAKLLQFAERVWGVADGSEDQRIESGIAKMEAFFGKMGLATMLKEYEVGPEAADKVVANMTRRGRIQLGERGDIDSNRVREILLAAV